MSRGSHRNCILQLRNQPSVGVQSKSYDVPSPSPSSLCQLRERVRFRQRARKSENSTLKYRFFFLDINLQIFRSTNTAILRIIFLLLCKNHAHKSKVSFKLMKQMQSEQRKFSTLRLHVSRVKLFQIQFESLKSS